MRPILLLLILVACVLPTAWAACNDDNTDYGDGCFSGTVEAGYTCPAHGECTLTPVGKTRTNNQADLLFQTNFNNGIFDISTKSHSFQDHASDGIVCNTHYCSSSSTYLQSTPIDFPANNAPRTVCAWVRVADILSSGSQMLFSYGSTTAMGKSFAIGRAAGNTVIVNGFATSFTSTGTIPINDWTHICGGYTGGTSATVWIDGAAETGTLTGGAALDTDTTGVLNVGRFIESNSFNWVGDFFDVRVYGKALSNAEVGAIIAEDSNDNNKARMVITNNCGNGVLEADEECDDNNILDNDGCNGLCMEEVGHRCVGSPSQCFSTTPVIVLPDAHVTAGTSQSSTAVAVLDRSKLSSAWASVPSLQQNRVGNSFIYHVDGLVPSAVYTVSFVFAETTYTSAKKRVFDVTVQGTTPQWSPIDVFATAGKLNTAIEKSFTTVADSAGFITIEFANNAIVQGMLFTLRARGVARATGTAITVANSHYPIFKPLKGYPDFTMEVYAYPTSASGYLIRKGDSFSLQLSSSNVVCGIGGSAVTASRSLSLNQWYHIACVADSTTGKVSIYIDGVLDIINDLVPIWVSSSAVVTFGESFTGYLDSPRLWQRALTRNEILTNAVSSAATILSYGLIEEWTFDDITSTAAQGTNFAADHVATGSFDRADATPIVSINCGGPSSAGFAADAFFVGGTAFTADTSVPDNTGLSLGASILQAARTGDFEYVVYGFPPRHSYALDVVLADFTGVTTSMSVYAQGVNVVADVAVSGSQNVNFVTVADYAGVITLRFTSASVAALRFTPVVSPAGSARFFVANSGRQSLKFSYQGLDELSAPGTLTSATHMEAIPDDASQPTTDDTYNAAYVFAGSMPLTISGLLSSKAYRVRFHFAELDSTIGTGDRVMTIYKVASDNSELPIATALDVYQSAGTLTPFLSEHIITSNTAGRLLVGLKDCSATPGCLMTAVEVQPGPAIHEADLVLPSNAQKITIYGSELLGVYYDDFTVKLIQDGESPVDCTLSTSFKAFDRLECTVGGALAEGTVKATLLVDGVEVSTVVIGTVIAAATVTPNQAVLATNAVRLEIAGTGFGNADNVQVTLNGNVACTVQSTSATLIVCVPTAPLALGAVTASVTSYGTTVSGVRVGTAVSPPQVANVPSFAASSTTLVIRGKGFIASPNHTQNSVVLAQAAHSRKRSLVANSPACTIISATPTSITCALSNVVAGPLSVVIVVAGGSSTSFTVNVLSSSSTTNACAPRGSKDSYDNTLCNCWSGYAPSSSLYADCDVYPTCIRTDVDAVSTGPHMSAPITTFVKDKLVIYQRAPVVKNRRDTIIRFAVPTGLASILPVTAVPGSVGSPTCGYPGNLWQKSIDSECFDVYMAQIPWSGHTLCGFVNDVTASNSSYSIYKAQMDTTYLSAYPTANGYLQRVSTDSYLVTVQFRKTLSFHTSFTAEFVESSTDDFVVVNIDSSDYDPNSRTMYVTLTAETRWPYLLNLSAVNTGTFLSDIGSPSSSITATYTGSQLNEQSADNYYACSNDAESTCVQLFIATFAITNQTLCDIAGTYRFPDVQLLCRDVQIGQPCPGDPTTAVQFKVGTTNLCEDAAIDPSNTVIPSLSAYHEPTMSNDPQTEFYDNDVAYMQFELESDMASIDAVTFSYIAVSLNPDNGNSDVVYDITQDPPVRLNVSLQLQEVRGLILAGNAISANFSFQLSVTKLVNTVHQLAVNNPGVPSQLTISASVDIIFHGNNKKRTLDFSALSSTSKTADHSITFHHVSRANVARHQPDAQSQKEKEDQESLNVGAGDLWGMWKDPEPQTNPQFDDWFAGLESSGDKLSMTSFVVVISFLLLVIIA